MQVYPAGEECREGPEGGHRSKPAGRPLLDQQQLKIEAEPAKQQGAGAERDRGVQRCERREDQRKSCVAGVAPAEQKGEQHDSFSDSHADNENTAGTGKRPAKVKRNLREPLVVDPGGTMRGRGEDVAVEPAVHLPLHGDVAQVPPDVRVGHGLRHPEIHKQSEGGGSERWHAKKAVKRVQQAGLGAGQVAGPSRGSGLAPRGGWVGWVCDAAQTGSREVT